MMNRIDHPRWKQTEAMVNTFHIKNHIRYFLVTGIESLIRAKIQHIRRKEHQEKGEITVALTKILAIMSEYNAKNTEYPRPMFFILLQDHSSIA
jgi:ribosomal protein L10